MHDQFEELKADGQHEAAQNVKNKDIDAAAYTFMSTNASVLKALDYGRGEYFPFYLYRNTAISTRTIDLTRALFDAGTACRPCPPLPPSAMPGPRPPPHAS